MSLCHFSQRTHLGTVSMKSIIAAKSSWRKRWHLSYITRFQLIVIYSYMPQDIQYKNKVRSLLVATSPECCMELTTISSFLFGFVMNGKLSLHYQSRKLEKRQKNKMIMLGFLIVLECSILELQWMLIYWLTLHVLHTRLFGIATPFQRLCSLCS